MSYPTTKQAYLDLHSDLNHNGFNRFECLLKIFEKNFGEEKIYFFSDMNKVRKELLYCINGVLAIVNDEINRHYDLLQIPQENLVLWIPNHNLADNEEDERYCDLIRFGGYEILEDGKQIIESDVILLKKEEGIQTLEYFTYQNIAELIKYIEVFFKIYRNALSDVGDSNHEYLIHKDIDKVIDNYWQETIEFNYAEFIQEMEMVE